MTGLALAHALQDLGILLMVFGFLGFIWNRAQKNRAIRERDELVRKLNRLKGDS